MKVEPIQTSLLEVFHYLKSISKSRDWFESNGCEIQRRIKKSFIGFECFGYKKDKLYIVALRILTQCYLLGLGVDEDHEKAAEYFDMLGMHKKADAIRRGDDVKDYIYDSFWDRRYGSCSLDLLFEPKDDPADFVDPDRPF